MFRQSPVPSEEVEGSSWPGRLDGGKLVSMDLPAIFAVLLNTAIPLNDLGTREKVKYLNVLLLVTGCTKKHKSKGAGMRCLSILA